MKAIKLFALIVLAASISSCALFKGSKSNTPVVLNYAIPAGQEFVITSSGESQITSEQMGQVIDINTKSSSKMECVSMSYEEGLAKLKVKYTEMEQSMTGPMGDGETDFSSLLNEEITVDLAAKGECTNFGGLDNFETITNPLGEPIEKTVFLKGLEQMFNMLPDGPVKVGTTWNQEITDETPYGGGILKTAGVLEYVVTKISEVNDLPCVTFTTSGTIKTSGKFQQQGMDLELNRTAKSNATTVFAYTKGMFLSSESSSVTTGSVEVPSMNMSIPQDITVKGSFKVDFK